MKRFLTLALLLTLRAVGQEGALPYRVDFLTAEEIAGPMQVDVRGSHAVFLQPESDGLIPTMYRRLSGGWQFVDTPSLGSFEGMMINGVAFNEAKDEVAVFGENKVVFLTQNFGTPEPYDWVVSHFSRGIFVEEGANVLQVRFDRDTAAVIYQTSALNLSYYMGIYERGADLGWDLVVRHSMPGGDGPLGPTLARLSDVSVRGDVIALGASALGEIRIYGRDTGGSDQWGVEVKLEDGPGNRVSGGQIELVADGLVDAYATESGVRLARYRRDEGGPAKWGRRSDYELGDEFGLVEVDSDGSRLLVLRSEGTDFLAGLGTTLQVIQVPSGTAPWVEEATINLTRPWGQFEGVAKINGSHFVLGIPGSGYEGSGRWSASFYGQSVGWSFEKEISDEGDVEEVTATMAMSEFVVAIGRPGDGWAGENSGAVLLYRREFGPTGLGGAEPLLRLESPDSEEGELFGTSVALSERGDTLVVGAPGGNGSRGRIYLYDLGNLLSPFGVGEARLVKTINSPSTSSNFFGVSVSFQDDSSASGELVSAGMPFDDASGPDAGAVFIYQENVGGTNAWGLRKKLNRPGALPGKFFGLHAKFFKEANEIYLVGTILGAGVGSGGVVVYGQNEGGSNQWSSSALLPPPPGASVNYGTSMAAGDGLFAVGAIGSGDEAGRAYLYSRVAIGWTLSRELIGTAEDGPSFGSAVSVSYFHFGVGAPEANGGGGRVTVLGGGFLDVPSWGKLFTRNGAAGTAMGSALSSQEIHTAIWTEDGIALDRAGPYERWAKEQGWTGFHQWFPDQDADGDRSSNLLEFVYGTDPRDDDDTGGFVMQRGSFTDIFDDTYPSLQWRYPDLSYSTLMVGYGAEKSTDMDRWSYVLGQSSTEDGARVLNFRLNEFSNREFFRFRPIYPYPLGSGGSGGGLTLD